MIAMKEALITNTTGDQLCIKKERRVRTDAVVSDATPERSSFYNYVRGLLRKGRST